MGLFFLSKSMDVADAKRNLVRYQQNINHAKALHPQDMTSSEIDCVCRFIHKQQRLINGIEEQLAKAVKK